MFYVMSVNPLRLRISAKFNPRSTKIDAKLTTKNKTANNNKNYLFVHKSFSKQVRTQKILLHLNYTPFLNVANALPAIRRSR